MIVPTQKLQQVYYLENIVGWKLARIEINVF